MNSLRRQVLQCYKVLHRTRQAVFSGDVDTLSAARLEIRKEFMKYKHVKDETAIKELIKTAGQASIYLRENIVQCKQTNQDTYKVQVRPELLIDDQPYIDMPDEMLHRGINRQKCSTLDKNNSTS